jgi:hypothetical protein
MIHADKADSDCRETRIYLETLCSLFFRKIPIKKVFKRKDEFPI